MALIYADRVRETSLTEGTGGYALAGAVSGFRAFVSAVGNGNTCTYVATMGSQWEVGIGTVTSGPSVLSRNTILASSNSDSAVNWTVGSKDLRLDITAQMGTAMRKGRIVWGGTAGGTGSAMTLTPSPALEEYWEGLTIIFIGGPAASPPATMNVSGLGAVALRDFSNAPIGNGAISDPYMAMIVYTTHTTTAFRLLSVPA